MAARLKERYQKEIAPAIAKEFAIKNPMAIPRLDKVVINMGMGEAIANAKIFDTAADELRAITGPETGRHQGKEVDRFVQAPPGNADWHDGHAAGRSNVRVPGSAGLGSFASGAGFSRRLAKGL